jgi:DHA2 family methylenomycin A resistance protein-like MFS transporter
MIATSVSYILVIVDTSIVSVGQVRIGAAPPIGVTGLQWVRNFYTLIFASLLLIGSARGDRWGPKRVYTAAIVLFTCALAICPDLPLHSDFAGWARAARREGRLIGAGAYRPAPSC